MLNCYELLRGSTVDLLWVLKATYNIVTKVQPVDVTTSYRSMNIVEALILILQRIILTVNDGLTLCVSLLGQNGADRLGQGLDAPAQLSYFNVESSVRI